MSGFLDTITDPRFVGTMSGLAQGFAQAAMPSRMPVPTGAALGMGAAAGYQGGQQAQMQAQQLKAAQMQNQRTQMGLDWYKQMMGGDGAPLGAPPANGGSSSSSSAPSPGSVSVRGQQITDDNGRYLVSPSQLVQMGNMSFAMGDPAAAATFFGHAQGAAGGPGYAFGPNGRAFAVPGGSQDPTTIYNKEAAQKWGGVAPAIAQAGGIKAAEAPYQPPISYERPITDANGYVVGTQTVQMPVTQWAAGPGRGGSGSAGAPGPASVPSTGSPQTTTTPQGASVQALSSLPNDATRTTAINAALRAGLPQEAWAPWISSIHNESGWNLNAPDGAAGEIGPGQVKPETGKMLGFTPEQLRDPATNLLASAQYFGQQWKASGGDPSKAMAGYNTGSVNGNAPDYTKAGVGRLAQWGYPGTAPSIATSPIGSVPPVAPPSTGMGGGVKLTPTAQANVDTRTKWEQPQDLRVGGMTPVPPGVNPAMPQGGVLKNPQPEKLVGPNGQTNLYHVTPASPYAPPGTPGEAAPVVIGNGTTPSSANGTAAPSVTPGTPATGSTAVTNLPPQLAEARDAAAKEYAIKDNDSYVSAQNTQSWLHQIDAAADRMSQAGPIYMTGPYAQQRYDAMKGVNDLARTLGLQEPFNKDAVASWEEMRKSTTTAGFELASHYEGHARQAAATIMNATSAVPGMENSPVGLKLVSAGIREGAQSAIDLHNYKTQVFNQTQGAGLPTAETEFYTAHPAQQYAQRAISTVHPVQITDPSQFNNYLPGTYAILPNGRLVQVPERAGAPPIPDYLKQQAPQ